MVCPECKGKRYSSASERGYLSKNDMQLCPVCHGTGEVPEVPEEKEEERDAKS
jgi:DnaJ-class molecular chaperone